MQGQALGDERRGERNGSPRLDRAIQCSRLRFLQKESFPGGIIFTSERGAPFATAGFAKLIERAERRPASPSRYCCY